MRRMRIPRLTLAILVLLFAEPALAAKKAIPPTEKDLADVWIGFDKYYLNFIRLELHADSTGYFAQVYQLSLHNYGVQIYRIDKWSVEGWNLVFDLTPISSNAEAIYLKGRAGRAVLTLEMGGLKKNKWKRGVVLNPESSIQDSNAEARRAISAVESGRKSPFHH
jgi:hypothetical protein